MERVHLKKLWRVDFISLFPICDGKKCICFLLSLAFTFNCSGAIYFDYIAGQTDVEKLQNLPSLVQANIDTIGTNYSLEGGNPQLFILNTMVKVVFSNRIYDFSTVQAPVDMGNCFAFVGEKGRPIFLCGSSGLIRFSQRNTLIENIAFVGSRSPTPPIIIYSGDVEEPNAWGREADGGDIRILGCSFKGFDVVMRTRPGQHTNSAYFRLADCVFTNCVQLSDNLKFDAALIENSSFYPNLESSKAFIVNTGSMYLRDIFAVPQSDYEPLQDARWIDNYGLVLDVQRSRFGNESVNISNEIYAQQVSLAYNYTSYGTIYGTTTVQEVSRNRLAIKDNIIYARNAPVVKFFEIPNHVIIVGNTGLTGKVLNMQTQQEIDSSYLCAFDSNLSMPDITMGPYISFDIFSNNRALKITEDDPNLLPIPLRYFGAEQRGTMSIGNCGDSGTAYLVTDLNKDCYIDYMDFASFAKSWLTCNDPENVICN